MNEKEVEGEVERRVEREGLRDGTRVSIRPIRPEDAPRLQALFTRLSPTSIYLRFLGYRKMPSDEEARSLAEVDYHNRMAFVAFVESELEERIIGVARYAAVENAVPRAAEAAVVVEDEYQGRGLGTILLKRLVDYAREDGVHSLWATVHRNNAQILRFVKRSGLPVERRALTEGTWDIRVHLED
jgi:RimJ/RimL family protein N-acetyltransferase